MTTARKKFVISLLRLKSVSKVLKSRAFWEFALDRECIEMSFAVVERGLPQILQLLAHPVVQSMVRAIGNGSQDIVQTILLDFRQLEQLLQARDEEGREYVQSLFLKALVSACAHPAVAGLLRDARVHAVLFNDDVPSTIRAHLGEYSRRWSVIQQSHQHRSPTQDSPQASATSWVDGAANPAAAVAAESTAGAAAEASSTIADSIPRVQCELEYMADVAALVRDVLHDPHVAVCLHALRDHQDAVAIVMQRLEEVIAHAATLDASSEVWAWTPLRLTAVCFLHHVYHQSGAADGHSAVSNEDALTMALAPVHHASAVAAAADIALFTSTTSPPRGAARTAASPAGAAVPPPRSNSGRSHDTTSPAGVHSKHKPNSKRGAGAGSSHRSAAQASSLLPPEIAPEPLLHIDAPTAGPFAQLLLDPRFYIALCDAFIAYARSVASLRSFHLHQPAQSTVDTATVAR